MDANADSAALAEAALESDSEDGAAETVAEAGDGGAPTDGAANDAADEAFEVAADSGEERVAKFDFENKVFQAPGARFFYSRRSEEIFFSVTLGSVDAALPLNALRDEFGVDPKSRDAELIGLVMRGIKYVKDIRPGDAIPRELLDGEASWTIQESHRANAKLKLMAATLDWLGGGGGGTLRSRIESLSQDEEGRKKANEALARIAEELELGEGGKEQVIERFEKLAHELGYIEALRAYYGRVRQIHHNLKMLRTIYASDKQFAESISRMMNLIEAPIVDINERFRHIDAHTEDVKAAIRNFEAEIEYIREIRDGLHQDSLLWDELLALWKNVAPEKSEKAENVLKETYRFLAQNFAVSQQWNRG